jgi:hypothetical protein
LASVITVDVSEGNISAFTSKVLEILPASITRDAGDNNTETWRAPIGARSLVLRRFAARPVLLGKFNDDTLPKELLVSKLLKGFFSITRAFKFDKTEACHNTTVNDATEAVEKLVHIFSA